uniref:ShKT domain-containing protein n=1 Tax=Strongyloides venezuelensis TaxID=75913 RepID=A0A0K0FYJ8_STRVS
MKHLCTNATYVEIMRTQCPSTCRICTPSSTAINITVIKIFTGNMVYVCQQLRCPSNCCCKNRRCVTVRIST